jgi:hypothetical protein
MGDQRVDVQSVQQEKAFSGSPKSSFSTLPVDEIAAAKISADRAYRADVNARHPREGIREAASTGGSRRGESPLIAAVKAPMSAFQDFSVMT